MAILEKVVFHERGEQAKGRGSFVVVVPRSDLTAMWNVIVEVCISAFTRKSALQKNRAKESRKQSSRIFASFF